MGAHIHATVIRRSFRVRFDKIVRVSTYQPGQGGVAEHGLLLGLGEDDHPQYHTDERGDARYYRRGDVDSNLSAKADAAHGHAQLHTHVNRATLDAIPGHGAAAPGQVLARSELGLEWTDASPGADSGDMLMSVYDADGDGKVHAAETADATPWAGVTGKPDAFPPEAHDHAGEYEPADSGILRETDLAGTGAASTPARSDHHHDGEYDAAGTAAIEAAAEVAVHESSHNHEAFGAHLADTVNPHGVTAAQSGADPAGTAAAAVAGHETMYDHALIGSGGGVSEHGGLAGLEDDDHPQYHTDARGDARYYLRGEVDAALGAKADAAHDHAGEYEPVDAGILRETDLAGTGAASTPARSDHHHDGEYDAAGTAAIEAAAEVAVHESSHDHEAFGTHLADTGNPHGVTAAQAGADSAGTAAAALADHETHALHMPDASAAGPGDVLTRQSDGSVDWQAFSGGSGYINGFVQRPHFGRIDATTVRLAGGCAYEIGGGIVSTSEDVTFTVGSNGSNPTSDDLSTTQAEWHYLYIAAGVSGTFTAADLFNSTSAPTWDAAKQGWYDTGGNRCVYAFYNAGNGVVYTFENRDDRTFLYSYLISNLWGTDVDDIFVDVNFDAPAFCTLVLAYISPIFAGQELNVFYRPKGSIGESVLLGGSANIRISNVMPLPVSENQKGEVRFGASDEAVLYFATNGFVLPRGM